MLGYGRLPEVAGRGAPRVVSKTKPEGFRKQKGNRKYHLHQALGHVFPGAPRGSRQSRHLGGILRQDAGATATASVQAFGNTVEEWGSNGWP